MLLSTQGRVSVHKHTLHCWCKKYIKQLLEYPFCDPGRFVIRHTAHRSGLHLYIEFRRILCRVAIASGVWLWTLPHGSDTRSSGASYCRNTHVSVYLICTNRTYPKK